ncbi:MAG TPA: type II toxin-antitoxin system RelE/ParE family toxin [Vicinamibacterales bacterium]|nr:type II toxin-antitoxin system RelE/ParE family toxin [Vicinamibacterales bacterium]
MIVSFNSLAEQELNDAAQYYDLESAGLGAAFLNEVGRCCASIVERPEAGYAVVGAVRRRLIPRFPYAVLYTLRPEVVRVVAIMNLKRRPTYWLGRT